MKIYRSGYASLSLCVLLLPSASSSSNDYDNLPVDSGGTDGDGFTVESVVLGVRQSSLVAQLPDGLAQKCSVPPDMNGATP